MTELIAFIEKTAIDSEKKPIEPSEIVPVMKLLVERLLSLPQVSELLVECLDDLRYRV